ncbi:uncharacterized protein TRAVEDRAFT_29156 [Trametes versicolor FP-101664 SS1]|uniref:uncharacterized protein n=1 Tax=Trametes versicolor (strain FP-101664) TaxID=717944 RepID=UPI0004622835|nr:uncharacterized protein TRAVEDRAFT_29156 [Trametes versicolor FP-101664 SS1]EIW58646.1 hypothetical protein TRAVEDRAFT_29156 [Trametes versicolor FP-101664 SS1]
MSLLAPSDTYYKNSLCGSSQHCLEASPKLGIPVLGAPCTSRPPATSVLQRR